MIAWHLPLDAVPPCPREAIHRLATALRGHGFRHLYVAHDGGISVLSVTVELTVWCRRGTFHWFADGRYILQSADRPEVTALVIAQGRAASRL
ncbi:hypothetical protein [Actinomadura alba]|uniref:Uncharacterized protein n=1 Tax=Actinomadura alba TaxID=406431 RepID=A0ABR7LNH9_9ACTN|nr:hypothetical protein [Actinomadura alba]MBC6466397.1 hypothetical protein [Actinomadura alba]